MVDALKAGAAEHAVIDHRSADGGHGAVDAVDTSLPLAGTLSGKVVWVFDCEDRFGLSVSCLLGQVTGDGGSVVVPDYSGWAEAQAPSSFEDAPADIDVIAGSMKCGVETVHGVEGPFPEGHVTAGQVFCVAIG